MTNIEKYQREIEKVKASETLDETTKLIYVDAFEKKIKDEERSATAALGRARSTLFLAHFRGGCPKCQYEYRPTQEEVDNLLAFRKTSNMKI